MQSGLLVCLASYVMGMEVIVIMFQLCEKAYKLYIYMGHGAECREVPMHQGRMKTLLPWPKVARCRGAKEAECRLARCPR